LVPCLALAAKPAGEGVGAGSVLQLLFGMAIVIGAIFAVAFVLRRMNRFSNGTQGAIKVIGGVSLGTRERAVLVQVGEQQLLVGVAPGRVQTLHVLEQPLALPNASAPMLGSGENFAERLAKLMKGKGA
jgi:flagellar protein FliO/FliZ